MQVMTASQHATALVHSYPTLLDVDSMLDCLASQHNEPSGEELLPLAPSIDTTTHLKELDEYVNSLVDDDWPVYKPFPKLLSQLGAGTDTGAQHPFLQQWDVF